MAAPMFQVFVGAETGLLKGVNVDKKSCQNLNSVQDVSRDKEICAMSFFSPDQTKISIGLRDRHILEYNRDTGQIDSIMECSGGTGSFKGLCRYEDCYVTCVESGLLNVWRDSSEAVQSLQIGGDVCRMKQNPWKPALVASGGKENDLKVWDLENDGECIFKAKNVAHDWLNLRVPVSILDLTFLPDSQKLLTSTALHQVRLYDPSAQKRPVMDMKFGENPITCLSLTPGGNQVCVGNSIGDMGLLDIRKGSMVHTYKGFSGAIRCVQCHPVLPLVATCGLDRFLRIHDIHTKELLHKFYLKSRLNCLLLSTDWDSGVEVKKDEQNTESVGDELWDTLAIVGSKGDVETPTKRKVSDSRKPHKRKREEVKI